MIKIVTHLLIYPIHHISMTEVTYHFGLSHYLKRPGHESEWSSYVSTINAYIFSKTVFRKDFINIISTLYIFLRVYPCDNSIILIRDNQHKHNAKLQRTAPGTKDKRAFNIRGSIFPHNALFSHHFI